MLQVIFTPVASPRTKVHCLAYTMADFTRSQPVARIVKTGDTFRAEGYQTGAVVAEGTMAECYDALRNYGSSSTTSYGDPDTDYRLLAL